MVRSFVSELETPCLVIHERILEQNLQGMAAYAVEQGLALRPHFKTHKTAQVVKRQIALGAVGITCAKLGEAEVLIGSGMTTDVFIANQIVDARKLARLVRLSERASVRIAIDSLEGATLLDTVAGNASRSFEVIVEINTGLNRAGVLSGEEALRLAKMLRARTPHLRLVGIMTHEGHVATQPDPEALAEAGRAAGQAMVRTAQLLREHGFHVRVVSVGSTPGAYAATQVSGVTEMRPGTYAFNDNSLFRFGRTVEDCALRILTTVTSRPAPDRAIIDAGSKVLTSDPPKGLAGFGYVVEHPNAVVERLNEEHGTVRLPTGYRGMQVGDVVQIVPNHVCPTLNLADEAYLVRDGTASEAWPIIGRGKVR
jgi:D-serine deaminase-like pyridoxal phosphate-dependent protein